MYYFAYGSNLSHAQMKRRCPGSVFIDIARLDGYRLIFCGYSERWGSAGANILADEDGMVWGALYELSEKDQAVLDHIEATEIEEPYVRFETEVITGNGKTVLAGVYHGTQYEPLADPGDAYLGAMKAGIADCRLESYAEIIFASLINKASIAS